MNEKITYSVHCLISMCQIKYSMCSLEVSKLDSPAVDRSSNPGSGNILIDENLRLYTTSAVVIMLIDKVLSSD